MLTRVEIPDGRMKPLGFGAARSTAARPFRDVQGPRGAPGATVFATAIQTEATDYRYAHRQGSSVTRKAMVLPDALAGRCLRLAHALGLAVAGIDLKLTPDQQV
jgi:hypothetical protein